MSFQKIRYFCRVNFCRMGESSIFLIDIDKVLRDKAGKKAERIPRFLVSYLKRIVHQEEINPF